VGIGILFFQNKITVVTKLRIDCMRSKVAAIVIGNVYYLFCNYSERKENALSVRDL
jgi:hypothetical protein